MKQHFIDADVQLSKYKLREVSRYQVALKASRTSRGVPLLEDIPGVGILFRPLPSDESSLQQNIILAQATIFPTLFDLMGLRWAPAVSDLDPLRLRSDEFVVRGRRQMLMNRVYDHSSSQVDGFLRMPEGERRMDLYRSQETIPAQHPNGYIGQGANLTDSTLQIGSPAPIGQPGPRFIPSQNKNGSNVLPRHAELVDLPTGRSDEAFAQRVGQMFAQDGVKPVIFICGQHDRDNFEMAVQFRDQLLCQGQADVPIFVWFPRQPALAETLSRTQGGNFVPFGECRSAASYLEITDPLRENIGRKIHDDYVHQAIKADYRQTKEPWSTLRDDFRESSRVAADHLIVKLAALGLQIRRTGEQVTNPVVFDKVTRDQAQLLAEMEHNRWVAERMLGGGLTRIIGELRKLGITKISLATVRNILKEHGIDPSPDRTSDSWADFLARHEETLWGCDFFSVKAVTAKGLRDIYVMVFLCLQTRELIVTESTEHPDSAWVCEQTKLFVERTKDREKKPEMIIHDRDVKYTKDFHRTVKETGMKTNPLPKGSRRGNSLSSGQRLSSKSNLRL